MKINTKQKIKNLAGKDLLDGEHPLTLGAAISYTLSNNDTGGKMKMYTLATDFYSKPSVDIDMADLALIKDAVEKTKAYNSFIAGQILFLLETSKDAK